MRGTEGKAQWISMNTLYAMATEETRQAEAGPQGSLCGQERLL